MLTLVAFEAHGVCVFGVFVCVCVSFAELLGHTLDLHTPKNVILTKMIMLKHFSQFSLSLHDRSARPVSGSTFD